ncbi:hypothetical protein [Pantoea ananatis]|uniref:hypothetical protein n=1 Tax=Pantoea ananas TaxID=553 RepID=UPI001140D64D|nr:hypothetical protein [Pantoea ananatis]
MKKLNQKEKDVLKYITLPVMIHIDDHDWVRHQLSFIHERYRLKIAYLYSEKFFFAFHNHVDSDIKRANYARKVANNFLRELVDGIINQHVPSKEKAN